MTTSGTRRTRVLRVLAAVAITVGGLTWVMEDLQPADDRHSYVQHHQRRQHCFSAPRSCQVFQRSLSARKILVVPSREMALSQGPFQQESFVRIVIDMH